MLLCHVCGDKEFEALDLTEIKDFDNSELSTEFLRLGLYEKVSPMLENGKHQAIEPPNKRRKVDDEVPVLDEITANLYELLGAQRVTSIDGLHQLAE